MPKPVSLLAAALLCLLVPVMAVADVEINEANFPDEEFRTNVVKVWDWDNDDILSQYEISEATWIGFERSGIKSLTGIEHFTALKWLNCSESQLTSLDVSKNTALLTMNCSNNQLTSLDVSKNPLLTDLNCSNNQLTSLDLSSNTALWSAELGSNRCTVTVGPDRTLDLRNLPGAFDVDKASNWVGGDVSNGILTVDSGAKKVTYTYDCGRGFSATFTLLIEEDTQSNGRITVAASAAPATVPTLVLPTGQSPAGTLLKYKPLADATPNTVAYDVDYIDLSGNKLSLPGGSMLCFPYPEGLDETSLSAYRIVIHHKMDNGKTEVFSSEDGQVRLTKQGICIRVSSLSPFTISWEALPPELPQTGDTESPGLWLALLALSASALALLLRRRAA